MPEKIIGILGGMGPEATIDLFTKIVKGTKVRKDQDHFRILIDNNPKIPDRTLAILGKGPSPLPSLIRSARLLERAGADFIVIPCVTAHFFWESLQRQIKVPILHLVEETLSVVSVRMRGVQPLGLLATTGTIQGGLFQGFFSKKGIDLLVPTAGVQKRVVMNAIYGKDGIKARGPSATSKRLLLKVSEELIQRGARGIIAGCTEIPLVLKDGDLSVPLIDPIAILARAAVERAHGGRRSE